MKTSLSNLFNALADSVQDLTDEEIIEECGGMDAEEIRENLLTAVRKFKLKKMVDANMESPYSAKWDKK